MIYIIALLWWGSKPADLYDYYTYKTESDFCKALNDPDTTQSKGWIIKEGFRVNLTIKPPRIERIKCTITVEKIEILNGENK